MKCDHCQGDHHHKKCDRCPECKEFGHRPQECPTKKHPNGVVYMAKPCAGRMKEKFDETVDPILFIKEWRAKYPNHPFPVGIDVESILVKREDKPDKTYPVAAIVATEVLSS